MATKTRLQWFNTLPEPYKTQAINNTIQQNEDLLEEKDNILTFALSGGFAWRETPEGLDYWKDFHDSLGVK